MTWQESMRADMRARGLPRAIARAPGEANVLVEYLGEVYRNTSGAPREIQVDVDWILSHRIAVDLGDGATMAVIRPSGRVDRWERRERHWVRLA